MPRHQSAHQRVRTFADVKLSKMSTSSLRRLLQALGRSTRRDQQADLTNELRTPWQCSCSVQRVCHIAAYSLSSRSKAAVYRAPISHAVAKERAGGRRPLLTATAGRAGVRRATDFVAWYLEVIQLRPAP